MGPVSAKTYFSYRPTVQGTRPIREADYGRRAKCWVFGGLEPHTGAVLTTCSDRRDTASFLGFLNAVVQHGSEGELYLIMDNLSIHKRLDVRLWLLVHPRVHFLFQPTYAPWLNLIEPWWKTLRSLALKGRRFETQQQLTDAIHGATAYWNQQRHPYTWRKAA